VAMGIFIVGDDEKRMGKVGKAQRQREVLPASAIMESYPPVAVSMTGMVRHAPRRRCVAPGAPSLSLGGGDTAPDGIGLWGMRLGAVFYPAYHQGLWGRFWGGNWRYSY
jgi:hypothetical protein